MNTAYLKSVRFQGLKSGPKLIILGAVHGNEVCGTQGILRVLQEIENQQIVIQRGTVTFVPVTNPLAYQKVNRSGDRNLNRNLRETPTPVDYEDHIANQLCPLLKEHDVLLDLHSFQAPGEPFVFLGPENNNGSLQPFERSDQETTLAVRLGPRRLIHGWLETFADGVQHRNALAQTAEARASLINTDPCYGVGTTEFMRANGGYAVTLECGQHADPQAPEVAYQAIINTLAHLGMIQTQDPLPVENIELLRISEVHDRQDVGDAFTRNWVSFDRLRQGELIAKRANGQEMRAPRDGFILFPNAGATPGNEWFYFAEQSSRQLKS